MFFHEFIYELKSIFRNKEELFWVLVFPIILGVMFHIAFGNINNTTENFHTIPVAACIEDGIHGTAFQEVLDTLSKEGDTPFIHVTYTDRTKALQLLEDNSVHGIFMVGDDVTLTCRPVNSSDSNATLAIEQSILEAFLEEYHTNAAAITEIMSKSPEKLPKVLSLMETNPSFKKELKLTEGNLDNMIQYFYNLIAMACLYTSFAGSAIAIHNQANLSSLAARKCISPNGKFVSITAHLAACILSQFLCLAVNIFFLVYVLKIDFATPVPLLLLTTFASCIMGVSFGFFVGSIGRMGEGIKFGIMIAVTMVSCFFSGLMVGNMRSIIESICPFLNDINPAVLISDSFLTLNIYGVTERYIHNILFILLFAAVFLCLGCLKIRRKTYASL